MKTLELIELLRQRIIVYRQKKTNSGGLTDFELTCCTAVELSVIFAELYYKNGRRISAEELLYFQGGRFIDDIIGSEPEYRDIYDLYYVLCNKVRK